MIFLNTDGSVDRRHIAVGDMHRIYVLNNDKVQWLISIEESYWRFSIRFLRGTI